MWVGVMDLESSVVREVRQVSLVLSNFVLMVGDRGLCGVCYQYDMIMLAVVRL